MATIGEDDDGDPITSCVVVDQGKVAPKAPKQGKPPTNAEKVLAALADAIAQDGMRPPPGVSVPEGVGRVVSREYWRTWLLRRIDGESEEGRSATFRRERKALRNAGKVTGAGDFVWLGDNTAQSAAQVARNSRR